MFHFTAEAVFNEIITLNELKNTAEDSRAKILGILLPFMAYAYGPQYVRDLWKKSNCKWEQFVGSGNVDQFIEQNVSVCLRALFCECAFRELFIKSFATN